MKVPVIKESSSRRRHYSEAAVCMFRFALLLFYDGSRGFFFFGQKNRARQIRIDRVAAAAATNNTQLGPNKKESAVGFE